MKRLYRDLFVAILCFTTLLAGCAYFSPSSKENRSEAAVVKTKANIDTVNKDIINEAKGLVYATDYSLRLSPDTNKYTEIAKEMASRAVETLAPIDKVDILKMRAIVDGLASTNKQIIARAQSMLEEKDNEIITLQGRLSDYQLILKEKEAKFVEVSRENAKMGDFLYNIKKWLWRIVIVIVVFFILNVITQVAPPPFNSLAAIFGIPFSIIIRMIRAIIPSASKYAGVVSEKLHTETQNTTEKLVLAINELKTIDKPSYEKLKPILADKTDQEARNKILEIKKDYSLI